MYTSAAMKKRLRKKYHVGEFRELGFKVIFEYKGHIDDAECAALDEALFSECLDKAGIQGGGLCKATDDESVLFDLLLYANPASATTDEHRTVVKNWLETQEKVVIKHLGDLIDIWYTLDFPELP